MARLSPRTPPTCFLLKAGSVCLAAGPCTAPSSLLATDDNSILELFDEYRPCSHAPHPVSRQLRGRRKHLLGTYNHQAHVSTTEQRSDQHTSRIGFLPARIPRPVGGKAHWHGRHSYIYIYIYIHNNSFITATV